MQHPSSTAATRKGRALLPALAFTLVLTATTPGIGSGGSRGDGANLHGLVREFNAICFELQKARADLASRVLDDTEFGDRILGLFVRADSIKSLFESEFPKARRVGPAYALDWALQHLMESLQENYEGIVEGNGYRFVTADLALKAAEAWKGSLVEQVSPAR